MYINQLIHGRFINFVSIFAANRTSLFKLPFRNKLSTSNGSKQSHQFSPAPVHVPTSPRTERDIAMMQKNENLKRMIYERLNSRTSASLPNLLHENEKIQQNNEASLSFDNDNQASSNYVDEKATNDEVKEKPIEVFAKVKKAPPRPMPRQLSITDVSSTETSTETILCENEDYQVTFDEPDAVDDLPGEPVRPLKTSMKAPARKLVSEESFQKKVKFEEINEVEQMETVEIVEVHENEKNLRENTMRIEIDHQIDTENEFEDVASTILLNQDLPPPTPMRRKPKQQNSVEQEVLYFEKKRESDIPDIVITLEEDPPQDSDDQEETVVKSSEIEIFQKVEDENVVKNPNDEALKNEILINENSSEIKSNEKNEHEPIATPPQIKPRTKKLNRKASDVSDKKDESEKVHEETNQEDDQKSIKKLNERESIEIGSLQDVLDAVRDKIMNHQEIEKIEDYQQKTENGKITEARPVSDDDTLVDFFANYQKTDLKVSVDLEQKAFDSDQNNQKASNVQKISTDERDQELIDMKDSIESSDINLSTKILENQKIEPGTRFSEKSSTEPEKSFEKTKNSTYSESSEKSQNSTELKSSEKTTDLESSEKSEDLITLIEIDYPRQEESPKKHHSVVQINQETNKNEIHNQDANSDDQNKKSSNQVNPSNQDMTATNSQSEAQTFPKSILKTAEPTETATNPKTISFKNLPSMISDEETLSSSSEEEDIWSQVVQHRYYIKSLDIKPAVVDPPPMPKTPPPSAEEEATLTKFKFPEK